MRFHEKKYRMLCVYLSFMLEGAYNRNGHSDWKLLYLSKRLFLESVTGFDSEAFHAEIDGLPCFCKQLHEMSNSTYTERALVAKDILAEADELENEAAYKSIRYEALTMSQKASIFLRLNTSSKQRKLAPWEEAMYNRLCSDEVMKKATAEEQEKALAYNADIM